MTLFPPNLTTLSDTTRTSKLNSCTDLHSNTAQVLTSLAEVLSDSRSRGVNSSGNPQEATTFLEEAISLFDRCLAIQERQHAESQSQAAAAETVGDGDEDADMTQDSDATIPDSEESASETQEERWATILEPVTSTTLLETMLAQMETLTTLTNLLSTSPTPTPSSALSTIEKYTSTLMPKASIHLPFTDPETQHAYTITKASLLSALSDALFRAGRLDLQTYQDTLTTAWDGLDIAADPEALCNKADALFALNTSLRLSSTAAATTGTLRWTALTNALQCLTAASKLDNDASHGAKIHLARGDAELLRRMLGQAPVGFAPARQNEKTLLKNAGKYYRGAVSVALAEGLRELASEGEVKSVLAGWLGGEGTGTLGGKDVRGVTEVLEEAWEEGLVGEEEVRGFGELIA